MNQLWYSVDYLYHLFDIKKSAFCPQNVFILFVWVFAVYSKYFPKQH